MFLEVGVHARDVLLDRSHGEQVVVDADDRHLRGDVQAGFFAEFADLDGEGAVGGEDGQRLGGFLEPGHQPASPPLPFVLGAAAFTVGLPAQLIAGEAATAEGFREGFATFDLRPVLGVAEEAEAGHAALDEVLGDQLARLRVILHHMGEGRISAAQGEVDGRLLRLPDEVGQIVAGAKPSEDAVAIPTPRDDLLMDDAMGGQMPPVLGCVSRDTLQQTMVIPAEGEQDVAGDFHATVTERNNSCRESARMGPRNSD